MKIVYFMASIFMLLHIMHSSGMESQTKENQEKAFIMQDNKEVGSIELFLTHHHNSKVDKNISIPIICFPLDAQISILNSLNAVNNEKGFNIERVGLITKNELEILINKEKLALAKETITTSKEIQSVYTKDVQDELNSLKKVSNTIISTHLEDHELKSGWKLNLQLKSQKTGKIIHLPIIYSVEVAKIVNEVKNDTVSEILVVTTPIRLFHVSHMELDILPSLITDVPL